MIFQPKLFHFSLQIYIFVSLKTFYWGFYRIFHQFTRIANKTNGTSRKLSRESINDHSISHRFCSIVTNFQVNYILLCGRRILASSPSNKKRNSLLFCRIHREICYFSAFRFKTNQCVSRKKDLKQISLGQASRKIYSHSITWKVSEMKENDFRKIFTFHFLCELNGFHLSENSIP